MNTSITGKRGIALVEGSASRLINKRTTSASAVHPFFKPPDPSLSTAFVRLPSSPTLEHYVYLDPFDTEATSTCSPSPVKIALCDLDGCLIKTKGNSSFPKNRDDWEWWHPGVKRKLKEWQETGYHVVIISNQKLTRGDGGVRKLDEWRKKMPIICRDLPTKLPLRVMAATGDDQFRKPRLGMWDTLQDIYREKGLAIDLKHSFFVGDAAGRPGDHSDTDRKWAVNAGLPFFVPEQLFKGLPSPNYPQFKGFNAQAYLESSTYLPPVTPTSSPLLPTSSKREIVLFVGFPACGKTTFFETHFKPSGYQHINQDTLKSREKCLQSVRQVMQEGRSGCVIGELATCLSPIEAGQEWLGLMIGISIDNTNRNANTRRLYVQVAREFKVPIRCLFFTATFQLARHNNAYRAWVAHDMAGHERRSILPDSAFASFQAELEEPQDKEGFAEVKKVNFVFGGNEADRALWSRWMF